MKGTIHKYIEDKGFGFIRTEDGDSVFFHRKFLQPGHSPSVNDLVEFRPKQTPKGVQAEKIILIKAGEPDPVQMEYPNKVMYSQDGYFPGGFTVEREICEVTSSEKGFANARNSLLSAASRVGGNAVLITHEHQYVESSFSMFGFFDHLLNIVGLILRPTWGKAFYSPASMTKYRTVTQLTGVAVVISRQKRG